MELDNTPTYLISTASPTSYLPLGSRHCIFISYLPPFLPSTLRLSRSNLLHNAFEPFNHEDASTRNEFGCIHFGPDAFACSLSLLSI